MFSGMPLPVFYIYTLLEYIINQDFCDKKMDKNDKSRSNITITWWLLTVCLFFLTGVSALDVGVDGIIVSTIAAGFMLVAIVIVSAILCYK